MESYMTRIEILGVPVDVVTDDEPSGSYRSLLRGKIPIAKSFYWDFMIFCGPEEINRE